MKLPCTLTSTLALSLLAGCASTAPTQSASTTLQPTQANSVTGSVTFTQKDDHVWVVANIKGLTPGLHGFHIHEKGDCSAPDATSAGGHFNPDNHVHSASHTAGGHAGDMGNLNADSTGNAQLTLKMNGVTVSTASNGIVGRAVIVHAKADDLTSQPAGNAGARVACGVIARN